MKLQNRDLSKAMHGDDVHLLQSELVLLGYSGISPAELAGRRFGETTYQAVLAFQQRHGLPWTGVVDAQTAERINREVDALGPVPPKQDVGEGKQSFVVIGHIRQADGSPLAGMVVRAMDRDLPSLNRDQQLGDVAITDETGAYEIAYTAEQFREREQNSADVIVYVFGPGSTGKEARPLAQSETRYHASQELTVDLVIDYVDYKGPSEYERIVAELAPLVSNLPLADLTAADIAFLTGETKINEAYLTFVVTASKWAADIKVPPEAFYGLLRQGLPETLPELLAEQSERQRAALKAAVSTNQVSGRLLDSLDLLIDTLQELRVRRTLEQPGVLGSQSIESLLSVGVPSREQQAAFLSMYLKHSEEGRPLDEFWDVLRQDTRFTSQDVENLTVTLQLSGVALGYVPLVAKLSEQRRAGALTSLRDLARLDRAAWETLVNETAGADAEDLPKSVPGKDRTEKIANYAAMLADAIEHRFPTAVLASRIGKDGNFDFPHKQDVLTFLTSQPEFELHTTHVRSHLKKLGDAGLAQIRDREGLANQLEALQRVAHIAPRYDQMRGLLSQGIDSAFSITKESPEVFVAHYSQVMGGEEQARAVYEAAEQKTALTTATIVDLHPAQTQTNTRVLRNVEWAADAVPDLRALFGSLDYCACDECRSVLSPAAYLVDVLEFLRRRPARTEGMWARDVLFHRRPDLGEIELTCENTHTEVPYIDLVNELLENAVAPVVRREDWQRLPLSPEKHELFQTRRTAEELKADPEHLNPAAYERLREAIYPWTLPFDLWIEEAAAFLNQLGTSRAAMVEAFRPPASPGDAAGLAIARDTLGLTDVAWNTIADTSTDGTRIWAGWGVPTSPLTAELSHVRVFLERSGLTFTELRDLLATRFINSEPARRVLHIEPPEICDLDQMTLVTLSDAVMGKIHRFVRLWRSLGWPMRDVDLAIQVLGNGTLDSNCLLRLADLKRVQGTLRVSVSEALSLWGPLDMEGPASLYQSVFWSPMLRSQFGDAAFDPARLVQSGEPPTKIVHHAAPILAALNLTLQHLEALLAARAEGALESVEARLTLENLSFLYRHSLLGRKLDLSIDDLLALKTLSGIDPFSVVNTSDTVRFIEVAGTVRASGFNLNDLRLLFAVPLESASSLAPATDVIAGVLRDVRTALQRTQEEATVREDPAGERTRRGLALLNWNPAIVDDLVRTLTDQTIFEAEAGALPDGFVFPAALQDRITYDRLSDADRVRHIVRYRGVMNARQRTQLIDAAVTGELSSEQRAPYETAIGTLYDAPRRQMRRILAAFIYSVPLATFPAEVQIPADLAERLTYDPDGRMLRFAGPMTSDEQRRLIALAADMGDRGADYRAAIDTLFVAPNAATQPTDLAFLSNTAIEELAARPDPAERFSALLNGAQRYLSRTLGTRAAVQLLAEPFVVTPEVLHPLVTRYLRSVEAADQPLVADFLYPSFSGSDPNINLMPREPFVRAFKAYRLLHNAVLVLSKFHITRSELPWLFRPADDPTAAEVNLNLLARVGEVASRAPEAFRVWLRLVALFRIRDRVGAEKLARIFDLARQPTPDVNAVARAVTERTDWRAEDIRTLITNWRLDASAFRDERGLTRLVSACDLLSQLGVSAAQCWHWSEPDLGRADRARSVAEGVKEAVRARYTSAQWTTVAKPLRDRLRERQAAALSAYLIAYTSRDDGERTWRDTNDLYAYFLVDVEMSACQPMTRIKLAHSSVQLFVQRCLMNLEVNPREEVQAHVERDGGWLQWDWMKNYRVWEANRQVFLYPENLIEPELRDDKTDFFKDLESDLLKDDLTAETAENAFLNYFEKLDTVGRLEICAMYRHPGTRSVLHVFGRTRGTPPVYYYRRRVSTDYGSSWTPWERVDLDIEGDQLIAVVWSDRLYLFWPVFLEQTEQQPVTVPAPGGEMPEPRKYSKMQLAWSQYRHNKWTPKTVSRESASVAPASEVDLYIRALPVDEADLLVEVFVRSITNELRAFRKELETAHRRITEANNNEAAEAAARAFYHIAGQGVTPEVTKTGFRLSGSDGTVRRLPTAGAAFVPLIRGTYLSGLSLVESQWEVGEEIRNAVRDLRFPIAVPVNAPEGRSDSRSRPALFEAVVGLPAIRSDRVYTVVREEDLRRSRLPDRDHSLVLHVPGFLTQTILRQLPERGTHANRFRVLLPYNQLTSTSEFFYQDDTRTFYGELTFDPEVMRQFREIQRSLPHNNLGVWFLELFLALGTLANAQYRFHSHYHPYVRTMMQRLNREGLDGMLERRVQTHPHEMSTPPQEFDFRDAYGPNDRFVVREPHPVEEMDFSLEGAYAQYNWELFFHAPLLIADKLSKNQRFDEAQNWFHAIFDPTDMSEEERPQRYWRTKPFFERTQEEYQRQRIDNLLRRMAAREDDPELTNQVQQWRENPFNAHLVARTRTTAFQRTVVMKYLDNLIAWADQLYRQESLESINEATQLYVMAAEILGSRPQRIERQVTPPAQTYYQLAPRLDNFANALVRFENLTPPPRVRRPMSDVVDGGAGHPRLGEEKPSSARDSKPVQRPKVRMPSDLYFCLLPNAKLLRYWDKVSARLLNIRHCKTLEGGEPQRSLFGERIAPELLVGATALGIDLRSALTDLHAPLPQYRFLVLLQKASELCAEVRSFGAALLSAWEKRDAEAMARMRSAHELSLHDQMQEVRKQQLEEAKRGLEALQKSKELISERRAHYAKAVEEFMNPGERANLLMMGLGLELQRAAAGLELTANVLHIIPNTKLGVPTTMGFTFGGDNLGKALEAFAKYLGSQASITGTTAAMTAILAGYQRRGEEWDLQIRLADKELAQIEKQLAAAQIRVELAEKEVTLHKTQMRQSKQVDDFMRTKFTNQELYDWMSRQLAEVYFQSYQMAFDMAKRAERSFRFERGLKESGFIQYGYWDSLHKGLMAGERLQFDLRRLEVAYLEQNRREHELTKHISLALHDPFALHLLRTSADGSCTVTLPESLFDRDHPGHYMRRLKSVALTLPAVVGPYTSVNCRLTLQSSAVRVDPALLPREPRYKVAEADMSRDTERFRVDLGSVQSIATSRAHSDTGTFEVNFRDERYLPFEGAGAISTWKIELDPRCNDFDLTTLSDVVIELRYTARDGGDALRRAAISEVVDVPLSGPQGRLFSARTDFADDWNAFLYPIGNEPDQTLTLDLDRSRFPFRAQQGQIQVTELHIVLALSELGKRYYSDITGGGIRVIIRNPGGTPVTSEAEGLLLRVGGDPRVGAVPGGAQPLSTAARVDGTSGSNRWQIVIPHAIIDALPVQLRGPVISGQPDRLNPAMFEDLLLFVVH